MVRVLLYNMDEWTLSQMPSGDSCVNDGVKYEFYIDAAKGTPDFVFVRNKALPQKVTFNMAPENIVLLTSEPSSVLRLPNGYCKQFGMVCSSQSEIRHPNLQHYPPFLAWYVGVVFEQTGMRVKWGYEELKKRNTPPKTKLMSVITSDKSFTKGHRERIYFVEKLKKHFGDRLDVFGRGFRDFDDKWDVLAPYKYHIAIENSSAKDYMTEKLKDAFLAETFPFYYGCTNVEDYFPEKSLLKIDIHNFDRSVGLIEKALHEGIYERSIDILKQAKTLSLDEYNMFTMIAKCCEKLDPDAARREVTLFPAKHFRTFENTYNHLFRWNIENLKYNLRSLWSKGTKLG